MASRDRTPPQGVRKTAGQGDSPLRNVVGGGGENEYDTIAPIASNGGHLAITPPVGPPITRIDSIVRDIANHGGYGDAETPLLGDKDAPAPRDFSEKFLGIGSGAEGFALSEGRTTPVRALTPDEMYNGGEDKLDSPPWSNPSSPRFGRGRRGEASLKTCVFNLVSTIVGGGALSLPFAMACGPS